ncbi:MAG TPA: PQQ-dependent sugar dehydrogenase [Thermomicrobiales bacterium]|nr:PQQ-dependent sugar dehydrogenase [Thermomicrobiales bacterium]
MTRNLPAGRPPWAGIAILLLLVVTPITVLGQEASTFDLETFDIGLEEVAGGFDQPLFVTSPPDGAEWLFVVEQGGTIQVLLDGETALEPFLDISDRVGSDGSEQGLLGLALAPDYAESGLFYVNYTDLDGNTVVSRFSVSDDPNRGDPDSEAVVLRQEQPRPNHNGGVLEFGPDGYLYIGLGDGGGQGDPDGNGQSLGTWLGKILRIDVDPARIEEGDTYAVPDDNPFVDDADARPEIWAYGLRNPWRFTFDRETGDLWVGDVGQNQIEEVTMLPAEDGGGQNLGWNITEGTSCYAEPECDQSGLTPPTVEYTHEVGGCSVTGGYVYRGESMPDLRNVYVFADFCSGLLWGAGLDAQGDWVMSEPIETDLSISSFGEDAAGELYLTDLSGGTVYRLTAPE